MYHINKQILDDELGGLFFFLDFQNLNLKVSAVLKQFVYPRLSEFIYH